MDLGSEERAPDWSGRLERTPFAAALAKGAPLVVARGEPPHLTFATPAALAAFGANGKDELEPILFSANGFASRRLTRLATETPLNATPRLELLRFFVARRPVNANWLCARFERAGETFFVAGEAAANEESVVAAPAPWAPEEEPPPAALAPLDGPVRFVWRLDADAKFPASDPALRERVGRNAPKAGETLGAFLARTGLDANGEFERAYRAEATFSGLRLFWPEPDGSRARTVLLSGTPIFAGDRQFQGFRGFGVFTGEGVDVAPTPRHDRVDPAADESVPVDPPHAPEGLEAATSAPSATEHASAFQNVAAEPPLASPEAAAVEPTAQALEEAPKSDIAAQAPAEPAPRAEPAPNAAATRSPPVEGGANALIGFLQRQRQAPGANANGAVASAPAMAVISALAALLQPKSEKPAAPPPPPPAAEAAPVEGAGAEIVVLRPAPSAAPANDQPTPHSREAEAVSLSVQERDAFKEIARALGANVRGGRGELRPPTDEAPPREDAVEPPEPQSHKPAAWAATQISPRASDDFADLVDTLPIAALVVRGRETLYANRTLLELVGYKNLEDFRRRDGLTAIFRGRDPEALTSGAAGGGIPLVAAGERVLTVDAQVRPAQWGGAPATLVAMRRSLEAEHQAELRAMERETDMHAARARDYAAALDAARDGMVRVDRTGRILGMNKGAERLFGCGQNEAAGESFLSLLASSSHAEAVGALGRLSGGETGPIEHLDAEGRDHGGRQFPIRLDLGRFANQPEPDYFLLVSEGAPASAKDSPSALEDAERASRAKTELLSRVSHEMRTPLHAIMGFAEVISEERFGPLGNERYRDYVKDILASAKHVLSLAGDLLDMSKIELGKLDLQFAPTDLNRVIRECVTLMQPQAARERIIMRLSLYDRLPNVTADERSLKQIMLNLMSNAVKYNEPGGQVIVSTALDDAGGVVVKVRDTGVGMNDNELEIALEPFRRVPGGKPVEGSGLGLPLTKALVEANHAEFTIKSRKDQGTLVEVSFPAAKAAQ